MNRGANKGRKGFAALYTVFTCMLLIPVVGLAVDFSVLYNVKGRLQSAVDAAAIAAGYTMHRSTDVTSPANVAAIQATALRYFNANYPAGYWGSTQVSYSATPAQDAGTKVRTIQVLAQESVPMLFMRVLHINNSQVAAMGTVTVRFTNLMIVVDRSGSISAEGVSGTIVSTLNTFIANSATSAFTDGFDVVGLITFGATWNLDFAPVTNFQTGSPNIGTAITNLQNNEFGNSGTNTAEGLYQAWYQLRNMDQPGALNVILLLTDGRPSAFSGKFTSTANCHSTGPHTGVLQSYVGLGSTGYPWWPPPASDPNNPFGLITTTFQGLQETSYVATANDTNCTYPGNLASLPNDIPQFPASAGPVDNVGSIPAYTTTGVPTQTQGYYTNAIGNSTLDPRSVRYAAFNVADNIATLIRTDTVIKPVIFVIGLYYTDQITEPLDNDWLARVANDEYYLTQGTDTDAGITPGNHVVQFNQTIGSYYSSTAQGLLQAFRSVASQVMRLSQ
ncbi:MAG: vWA domain-containing protein [Bryobacteraceae bacterium]